MTTTDPINDKILQAIKNGASTRQQLMAIEALRHRTWAVVSRHLDELTRQRALIASKAGWRLA